MKMETLRGSEEGWKKKYIVVEKKKWIKKNSPIFIFIFSLQFFFIHVKRYKYSDRKPSTYLMLCCTVVPRARAWNKIFKFDKKMKLYIYVSFLHHISECSAPVTAYVAVILGSGIIGPACSAQMSIYVCEEGSALSSS